MVELIIGILLGIFIVLLAIKTGFDKDSSFYPVLLIVISTNPPQWWPLFCLGVDVTIGIWLLWSSSKLLKEKK